MKIKNITKQIQKLNDKIQLRADFDLENFKALLRVVKRNFSIFSTSMIAIKALASIFSGPGAL